MCCCLSPVAGVRIERCLRRTPPRPPVLGPAGCPAVRAARLHGRLVGVRRLVLRAQRCVRVRRSASSSSRSRRQCAVNHHRSSEPRVGTAHGVNDQTAICGVEAQPKAAETREDRPVSVRAHSSCELTALVNQRVLDSVQQRVPDRKPVAWRAVSVSGSEVIGAICARGGSLHLRGGQWLLKTGSRALHKVCKVAGPNERTGVRAARVCVRVPCAGVRHALVPLVRDRHGSASLRFARRSHRRRPSKSAIFKAWSARATAPLFL